MLSIALLCKVGDVEEHWKGRAARSNAAVPLDAAYRDLDMLGKECGMIVDLGNCR